MKKVILLYLVLLSTLINAQSVPVEFQDLYDELSEKLEWIDSSLTSQWDGTSYPTTWSTALMPAISNRGVKLLEPQVLDAIKLHLEALDSLGVSAVDIAIQYPILVESFPKSAEYLNFYKQVVQEVRNQGFKLIIGCQSTFRDSIFGKLQVDEFLQDLTTQRYRTEKKQMIRTIINELRPDYLTIETEPSTQEMNLGLDFSPDSVVSYIHHFMDGTDKNGVLIGGGAGTWDGIDHIDVIAQIPEIDYIDFHIYPVIKNYVIDNVFKIDSIAAQYNKKLVLGECWLHKANETDLAVLEPHQLFVRDIFSFWMPLDSIFIESMYKLSHLAQIELTSLIWSTQFFAYVDYTSEYMALPLSEQYNQSYAAAGPNIYTKTFSPIGSWYHDLIKEAASSTSVKDKYPLQKSCLLLQNYPNPFNPETVIQYQISELSIVSLSVYNMIGVEVAVLVNEVQAPGIYEVQFNAQLGKTTSLSSGMYFYHLDVNGKHFTRKMMLLK